MIFTSIIIFQGIILGTICWKILLLDSTLPATPAGLSLYVRVLLTFFLWDHAVRCGDRPLPARRERLGLRSRDAFREDVRGG